MSDHNHIPFNIDAEQALLGLLLYDPALLTDVGGLKAIDFYEGVHQLIFAAMLNLAQAGEMITGDAIAIRLAGQGEFAKLGGGQYLRTLANNAPVATMLSHYRGLIGDLSSRRELVRLADGLKDAAGAGEYSAERLIDRAETLLTQVASGAGISDHWHDAGALCDGAVGVIDGSAKPVYLPTGLPAFDQKVGGLQAGRMNIIAARPSMGKSAVATCIALNMARMGLGVGMFSLEMDKGELGMRLACAAAFRRGASDNPMYFLAARGELSEVAARNMVDGAHSLRGLPLKADDRAGLTPSQIAPAAKRLIRQWERQRIRPGCIIVDHLTIVAPDYKSGNKVAEVSEVSGALRDLARNTGVTLLVLCQLSREVDSRKTADKRPQISDLRWSGEIEQDAAQITFLLRPEKYLREPGSDSPDFDNEFVEYNIKKERWKDRIQLLNEKNRLGPTQVEVECGISLGCNAMWEVMA